MTLGYADKFAPGELTASKLRFYSIGTVAANKALGSKDIEVTPVEELPMLDGEITPSATIESASAVDSAGKAYSASAATQVTIKASWLRLGDSNRMTPPDVRRGEAVMIYQFGDVDRYWWMTLREDARLRKLETVVWAISATKDENQENDATTMYYFEVSSHKKLIHLHTSKANGEPFAYDIQLDTKDGSFTVTDDAGNYLRLDSAAGRIELQNSAGSSLDIDRENITLKGKTFTVHAETTITKSTSLSDTLSVAKKSSLNGGMAASGGGGSTVAGPLTLQNELTVGGYASFNGGHTE